jgi:succinoglycan biosynthesis transport protein ExoP
MSSTSSQTREITVSATQATSHARVAPLKVKSVARQAQQSLPTIDLIFLLGVVRKGWFWMLPLGLLFAGIACGFVLAFFKPSYEAKFRLEVDLANYVIFKEDRNYSNEFVELQKAIMLGNNVLEKVISDPTIAAIPRIAAAKDPLFQLRKDVKVGSAAGARLIDVKYVDQDPVVASRLVNTIVDEYIRTRRNMEQIKTSMQERNVNAVLQKAEAEVEASKQRVRELSVQAIKTENLVGEKETGRIDTAYLDDLRMRRMDLMSQLAILEVNFAEAKSAYEQKVGELPKELPKTVPITDEDLKTDVVVSAAASQVEMAQREFEDMIKVANLGENNPNYIRAKRRIEGLESELQRVTEIRKKELSSRSAGGVQNSAAGKLSVMQEQILELRTRKDTVENQIREYMTSLKQSSASSVDLQFAEADLEEWNEIRATVHNRRIQLQTEREATDNVRELERAVPPRLPVEDLPYKQLAAASAGGLVIPILLGILLDLRSRKVDDANQLEMRSQLAVLGEIATIPVRSKAKSTEREGAQRELRLFEESVDSLSTTLILRENLKDSRVFAITSALSGEGKTSVACQLAVSISRATGKRVLLVDGDMRSPDVHHVFGREMTKGLVGSLSGACEWREAVDRDWSEKVHLLSAGYLRGSPHRLLSSGGLERIVDEARQEYDYVILDTPPVLPASEALLFARVADSCLVCALRDKSRIEQLIQAYHRLESAGASVAGSVLSGVPSREYARYYGEYYTTQS